MGLFDWLLSARKSQPAELDEPYNNSGDDEIWALLINGDNFETYVATEDLEQGELVAPTEIGYKVSATTDPTRAMGITSRNTISGEEVLIIQFGCTVNVLAGEDIEPGWVGPDTSLTWSNKDKIDSVGYALDPAKEGERFHMKLATPTEFRNGGLE